MSEIKNYGKSIRARLLNVTNIAENAENRSKKRSISVHCS